MDLCSQNINKKAGGIEKCITVDRAGLYTAPFVLVSDDTSVSGESVSTLYTTPYLCCALTYSFQATVHPTVSCSTV